MKATKNHLSNTQKFNILTVSSTLKVNFLIDDHKYTEMIDTHESFKNFVYKLSIKYPISYETLYQKFMIKFQEPDYLINLINCNKKSVDQDGEYLIHFTSDKSLSPKRKSKSKSKIKDEPKYKNNEKNIEVKLLIKSNSQKNNINVEYKPISTSTKVKLSRKILSKEEKESEEFKNCTFSPRINKKSSLMNIKVNFT